MPTPIENMKAAVGAAICSGLDEVGANLIYSGALALRTGAGIKPGALMIGAGALSFYLQQTGCTWPDTGGGANQPPIPGCWKANKGFIQVWQKQPMFPQMPETSVTVNMKQFLGWITPFNFELHSSGSYSTAYADYDYINEDGEQRRDTSIIRGDENLRPMPMYIKEFPDEDGNFECGGEEPEHEPVLMPPQVINQGDCIYNVEHLGWALNDESNLLYSAHRVTPVLPAGGRADGGRMGGCNFDPTLIVVGGDGTGGPGTPIPPVPPPGPDGEPWWLPLVRQAAATAAGNLIADAIKSAFEGDVQGVTYVMPAPCDVDEEGNPLEWTGEIPAQKYQPAVLDRLDALSSQLTQHLQWKTPICSPEPVQLEGDFRTISFRSDETSPYGKSRLRKRLRYRSLSGIGLGELVDHWKDFSFEGGPYRVRWTGGTWGTVEVWASSEAEGKRVIQHAAGEAGFDPFETGGWSVRLTSSTRLGVSGTMRVDTTGGYYWITERDGSNGRPLVAS